LSIDSVSAEWKPVALCSDTFAVLYSKVSKTPLMVVERLTRQQMVEAQGQERTDKFFPDPRVPRSARAELDDFRKSGFDRGHLAPAGNQPGPGAMAQSFALTNMVPQNPVHNQKVWSKIESDVRKYVKRASGHVFVFTGPLFREGVTTVGRNEIWVPTHLFKLVYDADTGRSWAYVLPNAADAVIERPMAYPEFVKNTGWAVLPSDKG
jgi:endonuclease G, mitochondrial